MKFSIGRPPTGGDNTKERLDRLTSWLCLLSEKLDVTLANLTEENFTKSAREKIFKKEENEND